jgi:NAD(P)-dependent dehydrogenase (short-subunit alcohol dehydrogenase family)
VFATLHARSPSTACSSRWRSPLAVAVVTGASRGIGRAVALGLAQRGFAVGLVARTRVDLEEAQELIEAHGGIATTVEADVTDGRLVNEALGTIEKRLGPAGVLVNNAGSLLAIGPLWEVDPQDWWSDVMTSLGGAFNFCRAVVPGMIERREGRIVNVTSYAGTRPAPYQTGYGCAKAALASLTESLAASLEQYGVKVFSAAPGFTSTEMTRRLIESDAGRRWLPEAGQARVVDIERSAQLICLLAGGEADQLNGRFLHALDDVPSLLANLEEIRREDLYAPRLRRLSTR